MFQKKMHIFDARFSDSNIFLLPGIGLSDFFIHILSCYVDVSSGGNHRNIPLACQIYLVNYYVSNRFEIIKLDEYEENKEFVFTL